MALTFKPSQPSIHRFSSSNKENIPPSTIAGTSSRPPQSSSSSSSSRSGSAKRTIARASGSTASLNSEPREDESLNGDFQEGADDDMYVDSDNERDGSDLDNDHDLYYVNKKLETQIAKSSEEIEHLKQVVTQLQASNANRSGGPDNNLNDDEMIPRPKTPFNIELEMGLVDDHARYLSVAAFVKETCIKRSVDRTAHWKNIPAMKKSEVFQICRVLPELRRCENDWATEAIMKQYFGNRRKGKYGKKEAVPPPELAYLAKNSQNRDPNGSRQSKASLAREEKERAARQAAKRNAKEKAVAERAKAKTGGKEKGKESARDKNERRK